MSPHIHLKWQCGWIFLLILNTSEELEEKRNNLYRLFMLLTWKEVSIVVIFLYLLYGLFSISKILIQSKFHGDSTSINCYCQCCQLSVSWVYHYAGVLMYFIVFLFLCLQIQDNTVLLFRSKENIAAILNRFSWRTIIYIFKIINFDSWSRIFLLQQPEWNAWCYEQDASTACPY